MGSRVGAGVLAVVAVGGTARADSTEELVAQGKLREALALAQREVKVHPRDAEPLEDLAYVEIVAGMGDAARRSARAAVQLEPGRARAHEILGWVLTFDTLGREYGSDHDRAGALAEYASAQALEPGTSEFVVDAAQVLERGTSGARFDRGCDLQGAAELWRIARMLDDSDDNRRGHAAVLLAGGHAGAAEAVARSAQPSDDRDALLLAAIATGRGAGAALKTGPPSRVIEGAIELLTRMRLYDVGRALAAGNNAWFARTLNGVVRHEQHAPPRTDPRSAVIEVMHAALDDGYRTDAFFDADTERELRRLPPQASSYADEASRDEILDMSIAQLGLAVQGAAPLWRVAMARGSGYVVLDGSVTKMIGTSTSSAGLSRYVRRLLARADAASAIQLLDWLFADLAALQLPWAQRFTSVWTIGGPRDADTIALAGALLAFESDATTLPVLTRCASPAPAARAACDGALADGFEARGEWSELLAHAMAVLARAPDSVHAAGWRIRALLHTGQVALADRLASELVAKHPDELELLRLRVSAALARHDVREAIKRFAPLFRLDDPYAANWLAWLRVTERADIPAALAVLNGAWGNKENAKAPVLNTFATVEVELGDLTAAHDDEWAALARRPASAPGPTDWYTIGRIAEQLGLRDDAIAYYRKVPKSDPELESKTAWQLAQERLKALGVK